MFKGSQFGDNRRIQTARQSIREEWRGLVLYWDEEVVCFIKVRVRVIRGKGNGNGNGKGLGSLVRLVSWIWGLRHELSDCEQVADKCEE